MFSIFIIIVGISVLTALPFFLLCTWCFKRKRGFTVDDAFEVTSEQSNEFFMQPPSDSLPDLSVTADHFNVDKIVQMALYCPLRPRIRRKVDLTGSMIKGKKSDSLKNCPLLIREQVKIVSMLSEGWFGKVYMATGNEKKGPPKQLVIKSLDIDNAADAVQQAHFLSDVVPYSETHGESHVLRIYGVSKSQFPYLAAYEVDVSQDQKLCDLKQYLLDRKSEVIPLLQLITFGCEMARGLQAIHDKGYLHHDLAARSFLVTSSGIKLGDFGCNEKIYRKDYVTLTNGDLVPLRWMDPYTFALPETPQERLSQKNYSEVANIWSLGLCFWEMLTLGQMPYSQMSDNDIQLVLFHSSSYLNQLAEEGCEPNITATPFIPESSANQISSIVRECLNPPSKRIELSSIIVNMTQVYQSIVEYPESVSTTNPINEESSMSPIS